MLKAFWSSDKKGREGIEFGDEWYKTLMERLSDATDVVCLLTNRSLERPWLLYEAGVAKGKRNTPVHGIALGIPLSKASTGPFYQFQNSDYDQDSLTKLVTQLCERVAGLEPDEAVVRMQVGEFRERANEILGRLDGSKQIDQMQSPEASLAKLLEELKLVVREIPRQLEKSSAIAQDLFAMNREATAAAREAANRISKEQSAIYRARFREAQRSTVQLEEMAFAFAGIDERLSRVAQNAVSAVNEMAQAPSLELKELALGQLGELKKAIESTLTNQQETIPASTREMLTKARLLTDDLGIYLAGLGLKTTRFDG